VACRWARSASTARTGALPSDSGAIRAAAETHHEIGPEYQPAVIESFLEKVGQEIDAGVDARLAGRQGPQPGQFAQPFGQPGQFGQPGRYGQHGQHGQVGQPGQFGQPGPYGQHGQVGQPRAFAPPQQYAQQAPPARPARERSAFALAVVSMALGIPLSAIAVAAGSRPVGLGGLVVIWIAIAVINVSYSLHLRPPGDRR
jgi:hypothetical protein